MPFLGGANEVSGAHGALKGRFCRVMGGMVRFTQGMEDWDD